MAACGSLRPLFDHPVPENPTLLKSLSSSWNQIKPMNTMEQSSLSEIFGELHFKEKSSLEMNSSEKEMKKEKAATTDNGINEHGTSMDYLLGIPKTKSKNQGSGSSLDSLSGVPPKNNSTESLQLCTEGLGFESSDEVEDSKSDSGRNCDGVVKEEEERGERKYPIGYCRGNLRVPSIRGDMPPPISCIGSCGKPWILFESIKKDGRFVLREIRIPMTEFLRASRKDGRLKLHLVQPDDNINEEEDDDKHQGQGSGEGDMDEREEQEEDKEQRKENCV